MRSIQTTAIILWGVIFMMLAFALGQFLASAEIFDVTGIFSGDTAIQDGGNSEPNDDVINKIGQETVRIGQNVAIDYFSQYYKEYVNYIMSDKVNYKIDQKIAITDELASDYAFYAFINEVDVDKYDSKKKEGNITISEGNVNSFIDNMFAKKSVDEYKNNNSYGYDKKTKTYTIERTKIPEQYVQELVNIENITSNQVKLEFKIKGLINYDGKTKTQVNIFAVYRGGRYIVTEVEKNEK